MGAAPTDDDDKAARYARLSALLDEWAEDESGFDERVEPVIEKTMREHKENEVTS